jgi:hypothetical protein
MREIENGKEAPECLQVKEVAAAAALADRLRTGSMLVQGRAARPVPAIGQIRNRPAHGQKCAMVPIWGPHQDEVAWLVRIIELQKPRFGS